MGTILSFLRAKQGLSPVVPKRNCLQRVSQDSFDRMQEKYSAYTVPKGVLGILSTPKGEIVLTKEDAHHGWSLPSGTVEDKETFHGAFCREVQEEVGVSAVNPYMLMIEDKTFVSPRGESFPFRLAVFHARIRETVLPPQTEDAKKEGLFLQLFDPYSLPDVMFLNDREKVNAFFGKEPFVHSVPKAVRPQGRRVVSLVQPDYAL